MLHVDLDECPGKENIGGTVEPSGRTRVARPSG